MKTSRAILNLMFVAIVALTIVPTIAQDSQASRRASRSKAEDQRRRH